MNLNALTNSELLHQTISLAADERRISTEVLWHLLALEQRMLHLELGYPSLFEFMTEHLKYSSGSAARRISAMRLLKNLPEDKKVEIKTKLDSGELSVTNLSLIKNHQDLKKKSGNQVNPAQTLELIAMTENKSRLEAERLLASQLPEEALKSTHTKISGNQKITLTIELPTESFIELKRLQEFFGEPDLREVVLKAMKKVLLQEETKRGIIPKAGINPKARVDPNTEINLKARTSLISSTKKPFTHSASGRISAVKPTRYVPVNLKREIFNQDEGQCTFVSKEGKRCSSRFGLEYDHVKAFACGGETTFANLRLKCRAHNQLHAVRVYGREKMNQYLQPSALAH